MSFVSHIHIAILRQPYLNDILDGKKTIESRFSLNKSLPYKRVQIGEIIFFKLSGGKILGKAIAEDVKYFKNLTETKILHLVRIHQNELQIRANFLTQKLQSKYATFIWLKNVERINPINYEKHDQQAWIILNANAMKINLPI